MEAVSAHCMSILECGEGFTTTNTRTQNVAKAVPAHCMFILERTEAFATGTTTTPCTSQLFNLLLGELLEPFWKQIVGDMFLNKIIFVPTHEFLPIGNSEAIFIRENPVKCFFHVTGQMTEHEAPRTSWYPLCALVIPRVWEMLRSDIFRRIFAPLV